MQVPVWIRGAESATLVTDRGDVPLTMSGLGGSVATPDGGIEAPVLVVSSFDDLAARADRAEAASCSSTFRSRRTAGPRRTALAAAAMGAVASLVRSVGPRSLDTPHTGTMRYTEGAERLQRMQDRGDTPVVRLSMASRVEADRLSRNVIAEVRGREPRTRS